MNVREQARAEQVGEYNVNAYVVNNRYMNRKEGQHQKGIIRIATRKEPMTA